MFDPIILPAGKHNWVKVPNDQIPPSEGTTVNDAYAAFIGNDMLMVADVYCHQGGFESAARIYATKVGGALLSQYGISGLAHPPK